MNKYVAVLFLCLMFAARWVAWAQSTATDRKAISVGSVIYLAAVSHPSEPRQVTAVPPGKADASTRPGDHSVPRLTRLKGFLASPAWSADGKLRAGMSR
jgi:hypothetical protein